MLQCKAALKGEYLRHCLHYAGSAPAAGRDHAWGAAGSGQASLKPDVSRIPSNSDEIAAINQAVGCAELRKRLRRKSPRLAMNDLS